MRMLLRLLTIIACIGLFGLLAAALLDLPQPVVRLPGQLAAAMPESGVHHPVTAVLLNFRGYDTLLEIAVLHLALLGVLTAGGGIRRHSAPIGIPPLPLLQGAARLLLPLMLLAAAYLLWAGSHQPGGAFQAGAILASCVILLYLAGLLPAWAAPALPLRGVLSAGLLLFLLTAAGTTASQGALLQYPAHMAGVLILAIEAALTVSLGLLLGGLFLWLPDREEDTQQ